MNDQGQLTGVAKRISSVIDGQTVNKPEIEILSNEYDALGRVVKRNIGKKKDDNGNYTGEVLQSLNYDFNIRGWLLGMNRNYLGTEGQTSDGTVFGFELGYDKTVNKAGQDFVKSDYTGNITGLLWKSDGDDIRRKYDFTYDATSRLMQAEFMQQNGDDHQWNNSKVNYNVKMGDGTLDPTKAYDANGNIIRMQQWGLKVTGSTPIDDLRYQYYKGEVSNKLMAVSDNAVGGLGDFTDNNTSGNDYGYDANGNMVTDANKRINITGVMPDATMSTGGAITYNHMNLPVEIKVKDGNSNDKGTVSYVYDATGKKLQKIVYENNVTVTLNGSSYQGNVTTTTTYLGGSVYETKTYGNAALSSLGYTDKLQFMGHEEGRVRYVSAENAQPAHYEYDYFIKDHLGNVRVVLTEQKDHHGYVATMERGPNNEVRNKENQLFNNLDASELASPGDYPSGSSLNDPNLYVAQVNGSDHKKAPSIVLKVMAGDVVDVGVQSFYRSQSTAGATSSVFNDILSSLAGGIVSASGVTKGTLGELTDPNASPLLGALNTFRNDKNQDMPGKPKAYLNWILLDEHFKYVGTYPQSNVLPVEGPDQVHPLTLKDISITKNGYLYVYVSNESENWNVFFDDLAVTHHTGPLLEETHYYPFGLTMAGISSKALNKLANKITFNGNEMQKEEFSDGSGLDMIDFNARNYDPQIGRFFQMDPMADVQESYSPYNFSLNNPILLNDPGGMLADTQILAKVEVVGKRVNHKPTPAGPDYSSRISKNMDALKSVLDGLRKEYLPEEVNNLINFAKKPGVPIGGILKKLKLDDKYKKFSALISYFEGLYDLVSKGSATGTIPIDLILANIAEILEKDAGGPVALLATSVLKVGNEKYREDEERDMQVAHNLGIDRLLTAVNSYNRHWAADGYGYSSFFIRSADLQKILNSGYLVMGLVKNNVSKHMDGGHNDYYFVYFRTTLLNNIVIDKKDIGYLRSK